MEEIASVDDNYVINHNLYCDSNNKGIKELNVRIILNRNELYASYEVSFNGDTKIVTRDLTLAEKCYHIY